MTKPEPKVHKVVPIHIIDMLVQNVDPSMELQGI